MGGCVGNGVCTCTWGTVLVMVVWFDGSGY